uniref:Alginate export domain-containing protein n=1 Tax=Desulfacinum infernum TaxID=35837 RepID=A0A831ZZX9_9BACT
MKKNWIVCVAVLAAVALAMPAFAVDFKYGGLYRLRWQSNDNVADGQDKDNGGFDDNGNWFDQRLRMLFTFVASENLQLVTHWEADTLWGRESPGAGRHGGGDIGADATNLEMKNVYLEFNVPNTAMRAKLGVQGASFLKGWMFADDFSGAVVSTKLDPVKVTLGYVAAQNTDVTTTNENVDDFFLSLDYANGPFTASLVGWYQYAHDTNLSTYPDMSTGTIVSNATAVQDNNLFNLGLSLGYKTNMMVLGLTGIKNFGSYDLVGGDSQDYTGWMLEGTADFMWNAFTFHLGAFYTTGDDDNEARFDNAKDYDSFAYARGASYYWSELLGLGLLDVSVSGSDHLNPANQGAYRAADIPSNLWALNLGVIWQALPETKLTLNYYYVATAEDVLANATTGDTDDTVGHEINFYLSQGIVDKLNLTLVAAYLFADDAYTIFKDDDDAYELGAVLQWKF